MKNYLLSILLLVLMSFASGTAAPAAGDDVIEKKMEHIRSELDHDEGSAVPGAAPVSRSHTPTPVLTAGKGIKVGFGLMFILFLAVFCIRMLKKLQKSPWVRGSTRQEHLEVMETCYLGNEQKVVLMRIHDHYSVVGVTPRGISLIEGLPQGSLAVESGLKTPGQDHKTFTENLDGFLSRFKRPKTVEETLKEL